MRLTTKHDLLWLVRAFLRQRSVLQGYAKIHHWTELSKAIKPLLLHYGLDVPSNFPHWLAEHSGELEDAEVPCVADVGLVFEQYYGDKNSAFLEALRLRQWRTAAKLVAEHSRCRCLRFEDIHRFFWNNGEEKCKRYSIGMDQAAGEGQAAVKERSSTDELLTPLADSIGLHDDPVYPHRYALKDANTELLVSQVRGVPFIAVVVNVWACSVYWCACVHKVTLR